MHAQKILNQAAADNDSMEVLNLTNTCQQEVIKMEYSSGLIFRKNMGWAKEQKMTRGMSFYLTTNPQYIFLQSKVCSKSHPIHENYDSAK